MNIYHKEIPNWIMAVVAIGMFIIAFLTFIQDEKKVSIRHTKEFGTQKIGDIKNNQGTIILHNETTNTAQNKRIITSASGIKQDSRSLANVPEEEFNDTVKNCFIPVKCRNPVNAPKVYSDPPTQNNCWLATDGENGLHDQQFGAIIKFGQANIVQRCDDKIFTLYRWSPSDNLLSSDILNEFYSQSGFKFEKINDRIWIYEKKWRTK